MSPLTFLFSLQLLSDWLRDSKRPCQPAILMALRKIIQTDPLPGRVAWVEHPTANKENENSSINRAIIPSPYSRVWRFDSIPRLTNHPRCLRFAQDQQAGKRIIAAEVD